MIRTLLPAVMLASLTTHASASEKALESHVIHFEANTARLTDASVELLKKLVRPIIEERDEYEWRNITAPDSALDGLTIFLCVPDNNNTILEERSAALEEAAVSSGLDSFYNAGSIEFCGPTLLSMLGGKEVPDTGFAVLGRGSQITARLDAATLAYSNFVPDDGWEDDWHVFWEGWFGRQLKAMNEPSFEDDEVLDGYKSRFRIAAYPNSLPAYAIRIDESPTGRFTLDWTLLSGAGGYSAGEIAATGEKVLSHRQAREFRQLLERAEGSLALMSEPKQDDDEVFLCIHGTQWTFETLDPNGRSFVERSFCGRSEPPLEKLSELAHNLAGQELATARRKIRIERFGE